MSQASQQQDQEVNIDQLETYLDSGWQPIPLFGWQDQSISHGGEKQKDGKRPRHSNWTKRNYRDDEVIDDCASKNWNMGIRFTERQLVIDVDLRRGGDRGFKKLCNAFGINPYAPPRVRTGSGGWHCYFTLPAGIRVRDSLPEFEGVEFKSLGRQVVAAGSIHPDTGKHYEWDFLCPTLAEVFEAPANLIDAIRRPDRDGEIPESGLYSNEQLAKMLAGLNVLDFRDYDRWLRLMMACHYASNGGGSEAFIEFSTGDELYAGDYDRIEEAWKTLSATPDREPVTHLTLHHYLAEAGRRDLIPPNIGDDFDDPIDDEVDTTNALTSATSNRANPDGITPPDLRGMALDRWGRAKDTHTNALYAVRKSGLFPAWNELKANVEFRNGIQWNEAFGRVLSEALLRLIRVYLIHKFQGIAYEPRKDNVFEALMTVAYSNKFNPIEEYLAGLKWDGVKRVESLFTRYIKCGDDQYTRGVGKAFLVGAVRRALHPGCKFDTMPVLMGKQGWLKSTAVKVLFGEEWFSDADLGDLRTKEASMKLRGIWGQEFAEIDSLNHAATGVLKAFVSRATDRQRDPYERVVTDVPRRSVFFATVNEGGYLKDSTGGRRFWPLELQEPVDVAQLQADRDQLWAEATALEVSGASQELPPELWPSAAERQSIQTTEDPWVETLRTFLTRRGAPDDAAGSDFDGLDIDDEEDIPLPPDAVHTTELFAALDIPADKQTRGQSQRIRTVMEAVLGWTYRHSVRIRDRVSTGYVRQ